MRNSGTDMELMITDFVSGCASHVKSRFALNKISACAPWLYIYPVSLQANEGRLKVSKNRQKLISSKIILATFQPLPFEFSFGFANT